MDRWVEANPLLVLLTVTVSSIILFVVNGEFLVLYSLSILFSSLLIFGARRFFRYSLIILSFLSLYILGGLLVQSILNMKNYSLILSNFLRMYSLGLIGLSVPNVINYAGLIRVFSRLSPKLAFSLAFSLKMLLVVSDSLATLRLLFSTNEGCKNFSIKCRIEYVKRLSKALVYSSLSSSLLTSEAFFTREWVFRWKENV
jgi:hypothetical protein